MSDPRATVADLYVLEARYRAIADSMREAAMALEKFAESSEMASEREAALARGGEYLSESVKQALATGGGRIAPQRPKRKSDKERLKPFLDQVRPEEYY